MLFVIYIYIKKKIYIIFVKEKKQIICAKDGHLKYYGLTKMNLVEILLNNKNKIYIYKQLNYLLKL